MATIPFVGPSYVYRSVNFDAQRSVNLMLVKSETGTSKSEMALIGTPGLSAFIELPKSPIRAMRNVQGRGFVVAGNTFYEIFIDGTYTERGNLNTSTGFVSMSDNSLEVIAVDGPNGYIFTLADNTFEEITSVGFTGANTVTFLDGYFVLNRPDTQIYYISGLYDGKTYDPLDFASAEGSPDILKAVATVRQECWLFGNTTVQFVYNSGASDFPLSPIQGAFIEFGCAAVQSIAKSANSVFWLGQDNDGSGIVWMATGYQPQRISTHAVEYAIQKYANFSDVVGYTYQEEGSYFYVLNFPSANTTWVYDVGMGQWHERAYFFQGNYERHRGQVHMFLYGKNLIGDYENGKIYEQSLNFFDDDGQAIRRLRTSPHYAQDLKYVYYNRFQLDMETGVGKASGTSEAVTPQAMLQWSNDGGHTWSSERWVSIGKIGQYKARAIWRRLGRARDRVFKVVINSKNKVFIIGASMSADAGAN